MSLRSVTLKARQAGRRGAMRVFAAGAAGLLAACNTMPALPPLETAAQVDLPRFMGDWYVIASIPTRFERNIHNAVERYDLRPDGLIATTFTYNDGAPDGPLKRMTPVGTVVDKRSNAVWTMRFIWPFEADYRIAYLAADYSQVIIGREKRDYVWIMARSPRLSAADDAALVARVAAMGYDTALLQRVPHRP